MKKGLRRGRWQPYIIFKRLNDWPDEEGIKTFSVCQSPYAGRLNDWPDEEGIKTTDRCHSRRHSGLNDWPDEEGIKTV